MVRSVGSSTTLPFFYDLFKDRSVIIVIDDLALLTSDPPAVLLFIVTGNLPTSSWTARAIDCMSSIPMLSRTIRDRPS